MSEHLRCCGQTEAEGLELPGLPSGCEPAVLARRRVDRDLKVRILQIYGDHPVVLANSTQNRLRCLHPKRGPIHTQIQGGQVDDQPPTPRSLGHNKHAAEESRSWRRRLHRSLAAKSLNLLVQSPPLDRLGRVRIQDDGNRRQRRRHAKRNRIPLPQDFHHPRLHTPVPPIAPPEGQAAAYDRWARTLVTLAASSPLYKQGKSHGEETSCSGNDPEKKPVLYHHFL